MECPLSFQTETQLTPAEFVDLLHRSTLSRRRPIDRPQTIEAMLRGADLIVTARVGPLLVGIARSITDHAYCTYLSDLAVDREHQRRGIGKELIRRTHAEAGRHTTLILLSAPDAVEYYGHIGMQRHPDCFFVRGETAD